ncbi:putative transcriptional regulator, HxlR family [Candidatus Nitrososphaera gargensis Ga9.2]|uniref:Putative transcriptional regulator, HxlR family n=1 Tax=Nitrososphaera gargensis (strain Ga9.2) TaxID=1237085 RepID=K0INZ9_NITGG|nr:winged helix-turn-helix transcriptional regulator [Candidatus Nitrososphaera gargensis]AFU60254.1 putative transcriptional regulator, HxlR family [Candidatus Nitrososphaera gargensis Ga9.2]
MIVYEQTRFSQFINTIDGINPKTLTARLRELERNGMIGRRCIQKCSGELNISSTKREWH